MYLIIGSSAFCVVPADEATECLPEAELAIAFGRSVRARLKLRISLDTIASSCGMSPGDCMAAVQFAEGPDWIKFRALMDDWSWNEIKRRVQLAGTRDAPTDEPSVLASSEGRSR